MAGMESEQGTARVSPTGSSAELTGRRPARPGGGGADRRGELDLLRGLVVLGLVFFHSAVIFGAGELPIKRAPENVVAVLFVAFGATWGMPLLFVVAGMGVFYSLRSRDAGQFVRERVGRLLVPLVFGVLTLVPLQVYLGLRYSHEAAGGYARFYRRWLDVRPSPDFPFLVRPAGDGPFQTGHLWFLACLLGYSLLLLPLFLLARRRSAARLLDRASALSTGPGLLFLPALPLAMIEVAAGSDEGMAGWNRYSYAVLLGYGYLAAADPRIGAMMRRRWRPALALAAGLFAAGLGAYAAADAGGAAPFVDHDPASLTFRLLKTVDGWLWIVAIIGGASGIAHHRAGPDQGTSSRPRQPRWQRLAGYANQAVLPFYILHETVIVAVAYVVLSWPIPGAAQYSLIVAVSLAGTLLVYDLAVRRTPITRWLFGLRPHPPPVHPHR